MCAQWSRRRLPREAHLAPLNTRANTPNRRGTSSSIRFITGTARTALRQLVRPAKPSSRPVLLQPRRAIARRPKTWHRSLRAGFSGLFSQAQKASTSSRVVGCRVAHNVCTSITCSIIRRTVAAESHGRPRDSREKLFLKKPEGQGADQLASERAGPAHSRMHYMLLPKSIVVARLILRHVNGLGEGDFPEKSRRFLGHRYEPSPLRGIAARATRLVR